MYFLKMNFKKLQTFDSSFFICQSFVFNDGAQLQVIFQPLYYTLKTLGDTEKIVSWKSKALSAENSNSLSPSSKWYENSNFRLVFK